jgi:2-octaprenyl-6-methoxyphenol hydroxylase
MRKIAIIGAGPVGLACANWVLSKQPDAHLHLFDRMPESDDLIRQGDSRGIAVSQGSHLLLKTINAWPTPSPAIHTIHISHRGHFGKAIVRREELQQDALGHIVRYADIHLALRQALKKIAGQSPNFQWHFNQANDQLNLDELGDVIVHAEGGLFKQQDWQEIYRDYQQSAIVGWVKTNQLNQHMAWERFTDEGPLALLPNHQGPEYLNLVWCGSPAATERRLQLDKATFIKELQEAFGSRAGTFMDVAELRSYQLGLNARKKIIDKNEVWIGNAAQTMHPVAGQGLNLGLRDAHTLADVLCDENDVDLALERYQELRKKDRKATIGATDFLARVFTSKLKPVIWGRGIALSSLQLLSPLKQGITRQMMFGQR